MGGIEDMSNVGHMNVFVGDAQPFRPVIPILAHNPIASLHIDHGTLLAIGFPNHGRFRQAAHENPLQPLLSVLVPLSLKPVLLSVLPGVARPFSSRSCSNESKAHEIYRACSLFPSASARYSTNRLKAVQFTVFEANFRPLLPIGPVINSFTGKRNFLVWKVIKLVAVLPPLLERFGRNLIWF